MITRLLFDLYWTLALYYYAMLSNHANRPTL